MRSNKPIRPITEENPVEMLRWYYQYARWALATITSVAERTDAPTSESGNDDPQKYAAPSVWQKIGVLWGSTPLWAAIGMIAASLLAHISQAITFALVWLVVFAEVIRVGFFRRRLTKIIGNCAIALLLGYVCLLFWKHSPPSKEYPTLDQQLDAFSRKFPWLAKGPPAVQSTPAATPAPAIADRDLPPSAEIAPYLFFKSIPAPVISADDKPRVSYVYRLGCILKVINPSSTAIHVRKLELWGEIPGDYQDYLRAFGSVVGHRYDYLYPEFREREPFYRILWTAYPIGEDKVDGKDEQYLRFEFLKDDSLSSHILAGDIRQYFGFHRGNVEPQTPIAAPSVWDIIVFSIPNNGENLWQGAHLKRYFSTGELKFRVWLNTSADHPLVIPPKNVRQILETAVYFLDTSSNQEVFFGTVDPASKAERGSKLP